MIKIGSTFVRKNAINVDIECIENRTNLTRMIPYIRKIFEEFIEES